LEVERSLNGSFSISVVLFLFGVLTWQLLISECRVWRRIPPLCTLKSDRIHPLEDPSAAVTWFELSRRGGQLLGARALAC